LEQQIRAMAAIKAAAPSHFRASFAREPQFGSGNPDYMANQTQNRSIAARQDLSDEDCRAEHFGNWLEDLPKLPDNIEHRLIHSDTTPAMTPSSAATNSTVMTGATLPPTNSTASPLILPAEKCRLVPSLSPIFSRTNSVPGLHGREKSSGKRSMPEHTTALDHQASEWTSQGVETD
jgi:hypothetical protein